MGFLANSLLFTTTGDGSSRDAGDVTFTTFISHGGTEALPLLDIPLDSVGQETVEKVGGGGGPGAGGETETTGHCRLVVWSAHTFPGPAPGPLPHTGTTSYAISQEIYNCFKYGQNRRHSPGQTQTRVARGQDCRNVSVDSRSGSLSVFSQCLAGAMDLQNLSSWSAHLSITKYMTETKTTYQGVNLPRNIL